MFPGYHPQVQMHEGGSNMLVLGTLLHLRNTTRVAVVARILSAGQAERLLVRVQQQQQFTKSLTRNIWPTG